MVGLRCKVCGKKIKTKPEFRYEVRKSPTGLMVLTQPTIIYEAFDCNHCGCQNIVGERKTDYLDSERCEEIDDGIDS